MTQSTKGDPLCSFCGKRQNEVEKLIAGPGVYICNECVALCGDIVVEDRAERAEKERERMNEIKMPDGSKQRIDDPGPRLFAPPEPTVVDLVANLRARCDRESIWLTCRDLDGPPDHVVLPVDLVLAIADGIEASAAIGQVDYGDQLAAVTATAAKEIVKLIVTRLFEPAKVEGERALDALRRLGMSETTIGEHIGRPVSAMPEWVRWLVLPSTLLGGLGAYLDKQKGKGGLGG